MRTDPLVNLNAIIRAITARTLPRNWRARASWLAVAAAVLALGVVLLATELSRSAATVATASGVELGRPESAGLTVGFDLVAKLLVVLALIYATATVARRYLLKVPSGSQGLLRVLDTTLIAPKKSVYVVEIGGRVLVIGATESAMSTLTQFDEAETVASLVASARPSGVGFQRYLEASLSRRGFGGLPPTRGTKDGDAGMTNQPLDLLAQAATRLRTGNDR